MLQSMSPNLNNNKSSQESKKKTNKLDIQAGLLKVAYSL